MKGKLFSVYDSKALIYHAPFTMQSAANALRAFTETSLDQRTEICKYPADFSLFEIGTFDDSSGLVEIHSSKLNLGTALEHQSRAREEQLRNKQPEA